MGAGYSFMEKEKFTWSYHCLLFDEDTRSANLELIDRCFPDGSEVQLAKIRTFSGGLRYNHFFITEPKACNFLELTSKPPKIPDTGSCYHTNRVQFNSLPYKGFDILEEKLMTPEIGERMAQMLGMCNYSLCLRNSEHVANYIFNGVWASFQMEIGGALYRYFDRFMTEGQKKKINIFPSSIAPKIVGDGACDRLYSMIDKQYTPTSFQYFCSGNEESHNILVVGPTGAGKSRLINVLFNSDVCDSMVSHKSVTRDVCFIEGHGDIVELKSLQTHSKRIVVADTVGLCDTEWDDDRIFELLKGRVSRNFTDINAVFVVFRADRLLKEHVKNIRKIMDWLKYDDGNNFLCFMFVGMFSENLSVQDKNRLKVEAREILKLKETPQSDYESLVYVGFPPEDHLNDIGRRQVIGSWNLLQPLMRLNADADPLIDYKEYLKKSNTKPWSSYIRLPKISDKCTIL